MTIIIHQTACQAPLRLRLNGDRLDMPSSQAVASAIFAQVAPLFDLTPPDKLGIDCDALFDELKAAVTAVCRRGLPRTLPPTADHVALKTLKAGCFTTASQKNLRRAIRRALQPLIITRRQRWAVLGWDAPLIVYETLFMLGERYQPTWAAECADLVECEREFAKG